MMFCTRCSPSSSEEHKSSSSSGDITSIMLIEQNEPSASDFTTRSLLMTGLAHRFALHVSSASARAAVGLFRGIALRSKLTGISFESSAHTA